MPLTLSITPDDFTSKLLLTNLPIRFPPSRVPLDRFATIFYLFRFPSFLSSPLFSPLFCPFSSRAAWYLQSGQLRARPLIGSDVKARGGVGGEVAGLQHVRQ